MDDNRTTSEAEEPWSTEEVADADLVRLVRKGAPDALAALYRRHGVMVYQVAFRFLASESDAQDVLQDVFVGLPEALRTYEERDRFPFWLKRIAVRAALMALRTRTRRREERLTRTEGVALREPDADVVTDYIATRRALKRLSAEQRAVLILKQVEGYSHAEIGRLLGISEGACAARLHRALRRLWELLAEPEDLSR